MVEIPYILITTRMESIDTSELYREKHEYFFISGQDEYEALEQFLRQNLNTTFEKMIIVPLAHSYKFIPGVDFPTSGSWLVTFDIENNYNQFKFFQGQTENEVLNVFLENYGNLSPKNIKIMKVSDT